MLEPMRTGDFTFDLPDHLIAQVPTEPRDAARLMVLRLSRQEIEHRTVSELPELLEPGDLLVVNDTRVMAARLCGRRADTGGKVEALLIRPFSDVRWEALFRPAKRAVSGRRFLFDTDKGELGGVAASRDGDTVVLDFDRPFDPATVGSVPLPPYIRGYHGDPERYQTIYSREARSAAAPTAGLHFTPELLARLAERGIQTCRGDPRGRPRHLQAGHGR